ncbi:potassium-transporting ATPase subunit B, partial [Erwinia amylovora]|nr:potassium-transporting ATPase subunit B [Erwinia amylovora]
TQFFPADGVSENQLADAPQLASLSDETPEGSSIVVQAKQKINLRERDHNRRPATYIPFSAPTRMSGVQLQQRALRLGAARALRR